MKLKIFLSTLLVLTANGNCRGASIGEGVVAEVASSKEDVAAYESAVDNVEVLEGHEMVPGEMIRLVAKEPSAVEELIQDGSPVGLNQGREEFPVDMLPVEGVEGAIPQPHDVIDEESLVRAEREADEDLLKALDSVLGHGETLEDIIKEEDISL